MCAAAAGMAALAAAPVHRYGIPVPIARPGCPCVHTPSEDITTPRGTVRKITTMALQHYGAPGGQPLNSLDLSGIHKKLEVASLQLQQTGSSNVLLTDVSFNCEIETPSGSYRDFITFDLKIPESGANEGVFSSDMMRQAYGSKRDFFTNIEYFFLLGKQTANLGNNGHGVTPDYRKADATHDQYILHTEQSLVAYLATDKAALMLRNYLRAAIRGKYPDAISTKIHNLGLHMHSTKTCCAPCEYTLIGLMNSQAVGLIPNFRRFCAEPNEVLRLQVDPDFQMVTTVTANEADQTHKTKPSMQPFATPINDKRLYSINVKDPNTSKKIFTTILNTYNGANLPIDESKFEGTVGISGSLKTPGSPATAQRHRERTNEDLDNLTAGVKELLI
jgi:hypothetical protein